MRYTLYNIFQPIPSIFQLPQIVPVEFCPSFLGMNQPATKDKETKVLKQETVLYVPICNMSSLNATKKL